MKKEQKQSKKSVIKPKSQILKRVVLFSILLVNLLVFYPSLKCGFVDWDDTVYVTENPTIALNSKNITQSFTKGETHGVYAPLTALSLSMNYAQGKMNPKPYHATNILLHLIAVSLVFVMLFSLSKNLLFTALVTLFFSLHPAQVESVTYVAGRRDLLFSLFAVASMLLYIQFKLKEKSHLLYLSIGCFLLSLLSKTQALLFPFLLFVVDYLLGMKPATRKSILEKIPYLVLMIIFGIITVSVKQASADFKITDEVLQMPFLDRLLYGIYGFVLYIYQTLIPAHLSLIHPYPNTVPALAYFAIAVVGLILFWCYWLYKHDKKTTLFGLLFFSVNLVLMLQFFPNSYGLLNDHYLYLPLIGAGMVIAHFVLSINVKYRNLAVGFVGFYILVLAITTFTRIDVFNNPISVNTDVINKYPESYVAYNNRGTAFYKKNDATSALRDFNQAITLNPKSAFSLNNRSVINLSMGKPDLALVDLNKAITIKPDYADAYSNRAIAKSFLGDKNILPDHNKAVEWQPNQAKYYYNRGAYYLQNRMLDLGCNDVQKARKLGLKQGNPRVDQMCP
jgi:protein O-mannosyl-transferase